MGANYLYSGVSVLCIFLHFLMLLPFISTPPLPGLLHPSPHQRSVIHLALALFISHLFSFVGSHSYRELVAIWTLALTLTCFPIQGPRILGDLRRVGRVSCEKCYSSCTVKGPGLCAWRVLHINLLSSTYTLEVMCAPVLRAVSADR